MDRLDVVGEHRDYCPWINPLSQNGTASRRTSLDGLAGWQVLWRGLNARTLHKRYETAAVVPATPRPLDDTASEVVSVADSTSTTTDKASRDEKDKERWAKLKRLKQVFHVKTRKGKDNFMSKDGSAIN